MIEHEMADKLDEAARSDNLQHFASLPETLRQAAAMLRAVPTRDQKIEALDLATISAGFSYTARVLAQDENPSAGYYASRSVSNLNRALRLLGLDDQETP